MPDIFVYTGALLARMDEVLTDGLEIRVEQMRRNLDLLGGLMLSERVMLAVGKQLGKQTAHEVVYEVAIEAKQRGISFREALLTDKRLSGSFTPQALEELLDPVTYLGLAPEMVDLVVGNDVNKSNEQLY